MRADRVLTDGPPARQRDQPLPNLGNKIIRSLQLLWSGRLGYAEAPFKDGVDACSFYCEYDVVRAAARPAFLRDLRILLREADAAAQ